MSEDWEFIHQGTEQEFAAKIENASGVQRDPAFPTCLKCGRIVLGKTFDECDAMRTNGLAAVL